MPFLNTWLCTDCTGNLVEFGSIFSESGMNQSLWCCSSFSADTMLKKILSAPDNALLSTCKFWFSEVYTPAKKKGIFLEIAKVSLTQWLLSCQISGTYCRAKGPHFKEMILQKSDTGKRVYLAWASGQSTTVNYNDARWAPIFTSVSDLPKMESFKERNHLQFCAHLLQKKRVEGKLNFSNFF